MVHIITDTTASLTPEVAAQHNLPVVPQIVTFGSESYREGLDIDTETFIRKLRTGKALPKTAAPPPAYFSELFQQFCIDQEPIICIHPSCEVSGTVRSAQLAAADFPQSDIRVIDTRTIAYTLGLIVLKAVELADAGASADAVVELVHQLSRRCHTYFRVATLEYLARGGRIGGAAALLGGMLQVKPILTIHDGRIDQYVRERTEQHANLKLISIVQEQCPKGDTGSPGLMYDGTQERLGPANELAKRCGEVIGRAPLPLCVIPPAIVTHSGPGVVGIGFISLDETNAHQAG
ncbi:MAG: DegV family protein [Anaerolineae bacterium]